MLRPDLDAICFIVNVEHSLLDLIVYLPGGVDKCLLHVSGSLSGCFHEDEAVFSGKSLTLLSLDVPPGF